MNKRVGLFGVAVGLLVIAGVSYRYWRSAPPTSPASPVVARVNETGISARELELRLAQILPMASFHGSIEPSRMLGLKRAALDDLILDELIYREGVKSGQPADAAAVEEEIAKAKQRFATVAEYEEALAQNGMTEAAFRGYSARKVLIRQARQAHADQEVTDADAEAYYRANAGMFLRPEQVHLFELLIKVDPSNPKSAGPAERKARTLAKRIRAGEPFGPLARENSEDEYRVKDGDVGVVHRGRLDADFEAAVFEARLGEVCVTRSLYGFHVFKVLDRQPATQLTFAEAKPIILERLARTRREDAERTWHAALRATAKITLLDPALRDATPAQLPAFRSVKAMGPR
jgi:peptidyl-prolyl cis-trans isomerase C